MIIIEQVGILQYLGMVGIAPITWVLILVIVIDIITGMTKALRMRQLNSSIGLNGVIRHSTIVLIVLAFGLVAFWIDQEILYQGFIIFYILNYVISIIENLSSIGVPFPKGLEKRILEMRLKRDQDEWSDFDV